MDLVWLAVMDDRQCYALPTRDAEERRRHYARLGEKIIGEYADRAGAEQAGQAELLDSHDEWRELSEAVAVRR